MFDEYIKKSGIKHIAGHLKRSAGHCRVCLVHNVLWAIRVKVLRAVPIVQWCAMYNLRNVIMRFCVLFALCAMRCLSSAAFAAGLKASGGGISPKEAWNPKKNHHAEDLTLRMPCGGQMVFRAVGVPAKDVLSDRRIKMGVREKPYPQREIYEHARDGYVSGPFTLKEMPGKWRNALKQGKEIFPIILWTNMQ